MKIFDTLIRNWTLGIKKKLMTSFPCPDWFLFGITTALCRKHQTKLSTCLWTSIRSTTTGSMILCCIQFRPSRDPNICTCPKSTTYRWYCLPLRPSHNLRTFHRYIHGYSTNLFITLDYHKQFWRKKSFELRFAQKGNTGNKKNLLQELFCNSDTVGRDCSSEYCECVHVEKVGLGDVVEFVMVDEGKTFDANHPMHLHGYSYRVVAMGKVRVQM